MVYKLQKEMSSKKQQPLTMTTLYVKFTFSEKNSVMSIIDRLYGPEICIFLSLRIKKKCNFF